VEIAAKLSVGEKLELQKMLDLKRHREVNERIRFFEPTAEPYNPQDLFVASPAKIRYVGGGNRSGKTEIGAYDAISFCLGTHPFRKSVPPVHGRVCAPKYEDGCKGVILKKFREMIPWKDLYGGSWEKAWSERSKTLKFKNGSTVNFKSFEMDINTYGGADLDFWWMDEHGEEKYFTENMARIVDRNGYGIMTMTPEAGQTWEMDLIENPPPGIEVDSWYFDTRKNPYLSKEGVATLEASIRDPRLRDAKLAGRFVSLSGMVFPMFDKDLLVEPDFEIPRSWPRTFCIDPHLRKPSALMWVAWDMKEGIPHVYRTAKVKKTVEELAKFIKVKSAGESISLYIGDEAMGGDGKNIYGEKSINKIQDMMTPDPTLLKQGKRVVGMKVFASCDYGVEWIDGKRSGSFLWELGRFRFKKEGKADEETYREHVATVDDDYISCFRYIVMSGASTSEEVDTSFRQGEVDSFTGW
jgi:phage terminase large subunit-like protein